MSLFKRFSQIFARSGGTDESGYWIYVGCAHCGEVLRTRVDLHNDLSLRFGDEGGESSYFTRKTLIGSERCFRPVSVELSFDMNRRLVDRTISGGEFITADEYTSSAA